MGLPGGSAVGRRGTGYRVQLRQTDWKDSVLRFCKFATGGGVGGGGGRALQLPKFLISLDISIPIGIIFS